MATTLTGDNQNNEIQNKMSNSVTGKRLRLDFLDGVRGLAALYVVVHHAYLEVGYWQVLHEIQIAHNERLPHWFLTLLHPLIFGSVAVDVFIVLSGFCLMLPVARTSGYSMPGGFWQYIKRRARRILPPYYAALIISLLIIKLIPGMHTISGVRWDGSLPAFEKWTLISHALMLQNLHPNWAYQIDYPMWSVAVEWDIYFLFPILLLPVLRKFGLLSSVIAGIVVGTLPNYLSNHHHMPLHIVLSAPWLLGLFAMGMAGATIVFSPEYTNNKIYKLFGHPIVTASLFLVWAVFADFWELKGLYGDLVVGLWASSLLVYCANHIALKAENKPSLIVRFFESKPLVGLGVFSYSLYLLHGPILALIHLILRPFTLPPIEVVGILVLGGVPVCMLISYGFHLIFERPFMNLPTHHIKCQPSVRDTVS